MTPGQVEMLAWAGSAVGVLLGLFIIGRTLLVWRREVVAARSRHALRWRARWLWWLPTSNELYEPNLTTFRARIRGRREWLAYVAQSTAHARVHRQYGR